MVGASDDAELIIHYTSRGFHEYQKIWSPPNFWQTLNIKHDKIKLSDPYAMGFMVKSKKNLKALLSSDIFLKKYPNSVNIS